MAIASSIDTSSIVGSSPAMNYNKFYDIEGDRIIADSLERIEKMWTQ